MQERKYVIEEGKQEPEREMEPLPADGHAKPTLERIEEKMDTMLELMGGQQ